MKTSRFNPRTPCGVRPCRVIVGARTSRFQSTHSLRSATVGTYLTLSPFWFQSTHSLRSATSCFSVRPASQTGFNPRTPCGVRPLTHVLFSFLLFQSTHSLRSATRLSITPESLPPVSIHALLAECDCYFRPQATLYNLFQSTHSLRSATMLSSKCPFVMFVSIHALLAECDRRGGHFGFRG